MSNVSTSHDNPGQDPEVKSRFSRKMRKLRRAPSAFVKDSRPYKMWAKMGSFALVILASVLILVYFMEIASPRYATQSQFLIKQAGATELPIPGLAALGAVSSSAKDSLIIKRFIESRVMAMTLDEQIELQRHYQDQSNDWLSRLKSDASVEEFIGYYQKHIGVYHDEMSDVVVIEVQAFSPEYALKLGEIILQISERFINDLGNKMIDEQVSFAQQDVERKYDEFKAQQQLLLEFQGEKQLFSPEEESGALLNAINQLQGELIKAEARYKELASVMRRTAPEVKAQKNLIDSLKAQLSEERQRLVSEKDTSLSRVNLDFQEIKLNTRLASDLYTSSLASLEFVKAEAYRKLKHLLIIAPPALPQDETYPRRWYNITTWFMVLLLVYLIGRLIAAVIREHKE